MDVNTISGHILELDPNQPYVVVIILPVMQLNFADRVNSAAFYVDPLLSQWQLRHTVSVQDIRFSYDDYALIRVSLNMTNPQAVIHMNPRPSVYLAKRLEDALWDMSFHST